MKREDMRLVKLVAAGIASEEQYAQLDEKLALFARTAIPQRRVVTYEATKAGNNRMRFVVSDEKVNRYGDMVRQDGWDLRAFNKNPVAQWSHKGELPPIGGWEDVRMEMGATGRVTTATLHFAADVDAEAARLYRLADAGFIRACSPGFQVTKTHKPDDAERQSLGLGKYGIVITGSELWEVSLCNVGVQPGALRQAVETQSLSVDDADWFERYSTSTERDTLRDLDGLTADLALAQIPRLAASVELMHAQILERLGKVEASLAATRRQTAVDEAPAYMAALERSMDAITSRLGKTNQ